MELIPIIILGILIAVLFSGCRDNHNDDDGDDDNPVEPTWKDFYPKNWYKPSIDLYKSKWQVRENHEAYENLMVNFMVEEGLADIYDDLTLANVLTHKEGNDYYFKWTSDMVNWQLYDYWATPYQFVIEKEGLGDCEDFAGVHCDYLYRLCQYWLVWWIEVYWKKKDKSYGHAITIYKRSVESHWRCFSNQIFLGMSNGFETFKEIIYKFVPLDVPEVADQYELIKVVARHPILGDLLFEVKELV